MRTNCSRLVPTNLTDAESQYRAVRLYSQLCLIFPAISQIADEAMPKETRPVSLMRAAGAAVCAWAVAGS